MILYVIEKNKHMFNIYICINKERYDNENSHGNKKIYLWEKKVLFFMGIIKFYGNKEINVQTHD